MAYKASTRKQIVLKGAEDVCMMCCTRVKKGHSHTHSVRGRRRIDDSRHIKKTLLSEDPDLVIVFEQCASVKFTPTRHVRVNKTKVEFLGLDRESVSRSDPAAMSMTGMAPLTNRRTAQHRPLSGSHYRSASWGYTRLSSVCLL